MFRKLSTQNLFGPQVICRYDYDLGWIVEELNDGEYEIVFNYNYHECNSSCELDGEFCKCDIVHTEQGRKNALELAYKIGKERNVKIHHYYEFPETIAEKRLKFGERNG